MLKHTMMGTALLVTLTTTVAAQAPGLCKPDEPCAEVSAFVARATDFRVTTGAAGRKLVTVTVRFQNRTDKPLVLGYVDESGLATDDKGNRYTVSGPAAVRGIGVISGTTPDAKFALQGGEGADARFELGWTPEKNQAAGSSFQLELAVREIDAAGKLGREHALTLKHLGAPAAVAAAPEPAKPAEPADACGGRPRCYNAGPFIAEIQNLTASLSGPYNDHTLRFTVKIKNVGDAPIILAYQAGTQIAVDNVGHRYGGGRFDGGVQGMGTITGQKADPQFLLQPGQSRNATFGVWRRAYRTEIGTMFTEDFVLKELIPFSDGKIRIAREFAVGFRDIGVSPIGAAATNLLNELAKKIKKP